MEKFTIDYNEIMSTCLFGQIFVRLFICEENDSVAMSAARVDYI